MVSGAGPHRPGRIALAPFTRRAIERIAENRIRQAMEAGDFDHVPLGAPIEGLDAPYDELWWIKQWIRRERLANQKLPDHRRAAVDRVKLLREVQRERHEAQRDLRQPAGRGRGGDGG